MRINILDFERRTGDMAACKTAFETLSKTRKVHEIEFLSNGTAVARGIRQAEENGVRLRIYNWQICICVTAKHFRMVVFTYTMVDGQEQDPKMQEELQLLDKLIVAGEYPPVEGISGDYFHKPGSADI